MIIKTTADNWITVLITLSTIFAISAVDRRRKNGWNWESTRQKEKLKAILMLPSHVVATKRCISKLLEKSSNNTALANRVLAQFPCPNFLATIESIQPVVDLAVKDMYYKYQRVQSPEWMHVLPIDVDCGNQTEAAQGFLEAREKKGGVNVIFGPVCDYTVATVLRMSKYYKIPLLSAGGFSHSFEEKIEFPITRLGLSYGTLYKSLNGSIKSFGWNQFVYGYQLNFDESEVLSQDFCKLLGNGIMDRLSKQFTIHFKQLQRDDSLYLQKWLEDEIGTKFASLGLYKGPLHILVCLPMKPGIENAPNNYFHMSDLHVKPVIDVAEEDIVRKGILPANYLRVTYVDSELSDSIGPWRPMEALLKNQLDCVVGYASNYALGPVARTSWLYKDRLGVPVITTIGLSDILDDKTTYRLLTRMNGSYRIMAKFVWQVLKKMKWFEFAYVFESHIYKSKLYGRHECYHQSIAVRNYEAIQNFDAKRMFKEPYVKEIDPALPSGINMTQIMIEISMNTNIIVVCGSPALVRRIMIAASKLGMTQSGEYVFVNIDVSVGSNATKPWYRSNDTQQENDEAREAFKAMKIISLRKSQRPDFEEFEKKVRDTAEDKYNYSKITGKPYELNPFISAFYEAVLLYSIAVNETLSDGHDPTNGLEITNRMWNRTFDGITGSVSITPSGDRNIDYAMLDYNPATDQFVEKAYWSGAHDKWEVVGDWYWVGGSIPKDSPVCGYDKSKCPQKGLAAWSWALIALAIATVIFSVVSFFIHRYYKLEAELAAMTWRIRWEELTGERKKSEKRPNDTFWGFTWGQPTNASTTGVVPSSGAGSNNQNLQRSDSETSLTRQSLASEETIVINEATQQIFTKTAIYKGVVVAIKKLNTSKQKIEVSRAMLLELKKMKDLQHDHITRFVGACIDPPHACIVTEYCPKGSLEDILENDEIKLDKMMIYSLLHDLVKGMYFIHSSDIRSHGNLKSSNCVVDSRFVLKITDFGVHSLHAIEDRARDSINSYQIWRSKLWTAPELLRLTGAKPPPCGTQKADVYSFAIILHEMAFRQGVFYIDNENPSPQDIISRVILRQQPPFRPSIDDPNADENLVQLMTKCWGDDPVERPDFSTIRKQVRLLNKRFETSSNIVDNLLKRMEQYATNLEGLVEERTAAYLEEKRKAENLLYQLLPQSVASELIQGKPVTAEAFDSVTIYFSDIVGFTSICSQSTPMEVVTLLGDLYTCFDTTIEHFDVYKVETIGDAYMVVSGLPRRNGNRHAYEVARMSLALLNKVKTFRIRHRPNDQLNLRIGLHSGSVCAGVVGLKMPRYCLFGDTVNTASRMESNGLPLKIHVSQDTKEILESFGCFQLELRGQVEMKGKGTQTTYWLIGENTNVQPRNLSPPAAGSHPGGDGGPPMAVGGVPLAGHHSPALGASDALVSRALHTGILKSKNAPLTGSTQHLAATPLSANGAGFNRRSNPSILTHSSDAVNNGPSTVITFADAATPSSVRFNNAAASGYPPPPPYEESSTAPHDIC